VVSSAIAQSSFPNGINAGGDSTINSLTTTGNLNVVNGLTAGGGSTINSLTATGTLQVPNGLGAGGSSAINNLTLNGTTYANGNVGIGTTSPQQNLSVNGSENIDQADTNNGGIYPGLTFGAGSGEGIASNRVSAPNQFGLNFFTAFTPRMSITQAGNVGIGTTSPAQFLEVNGNTQVDGSIIIPGGANGIFITNSGSQGNVIQANFPYLSSGGAVSESLGIAFGGSNFYDSGLLSFVNKGGAGSSSNYIGLSIYGSSSGMIINGSGNVGIGTVSPGAPLEVDGNIKLTANSGAGIIFPNGSVQSTAWTGVVSGGDYAESVDVSGDRNHYEPGDVMVVDVNHPGRFLKSSQAYSTVVAGIYATKPGVTGRRQKTDPKTSTSEVPMAMVGIVPTKVNTENGPIHRGDLLVSSSTPGYAMKGTDPIRMVGAVVGKALGTLDSGSGVIEVVVTLQ